MKPYLMQTLRLALKSSKDKFSLLVKEAYKAVKWLTACLTTLTFNFAPPLYIMITKFLLLLSTSMEYNQ